MAQKEISLLYITERILVLTFPSDDDENAYRSSLRHVSRMLRTKHGYNYKIFNNSRKRRDLAILNPGVVEFGWPEDLAPPLERLCSICKEIDNWITADKNHLVVLHENGGACRSALVVACFMHYQQICSNEDLALDRFAMKKFFSEQNVLPSQKRYVNYFAGLLSNEIRINSNPIYLYQVVVYGIPRVSKLYIKIYEKMVPTFMSAVYKATSPILTIRLNPPVMLRGDVVFKCFAQPHHLLFRCQFNTCAVDASTSSCFSFISRDLDDIGYEDAGLDLLFSFNRDVPMIGDASSSTTSIADSSQEDDDDDDIRSKRSNSYENFDSFAEDDATTSLTNIEPVNGNPFPPIQRERELSANDTADSGIHSVVDGDTEQVEVVEIENQGKKLSISSAKDQINGGTKSGEYRGVSNDAAKSSTEPQQPKVERKVRDRQPEEVVMYASLRNNNNNNMKEAENMVQNEIQENGTSPHTPDYSHHRPPPVTPPSKRTFSPLLMRPTSPVADDSRKIDPDLVATDRYDPQSRAFSYVPKQALQDHFKAPKKPTQLVHTVERTTRSTPSSPPPTEEFPFYEREQTGSGIIKPKTSLQGPLSSSDIDQLLDPNFYLNFTDDDSHFAQNQFSHLPASSSTGVQPHFSEGAAETKPLPPTSPSLANNDFYSSVSTPKTPKTPPPVMAKPTRRLDPAEESLLRDLEEYDPHRTRAPQPHVPHQQLDVHAAPASVGRPPESLYIQNRTWSPAVAPPSTPISRQVAPSPVASIQSVDSMRSPSSPRKVYHQEPRWEDALNDVPQFTAIRSTPIQEKVQSTPVQEQMRGTPLLDKMRATPLQEKSRSTPVQQEPMQQDLPYASYQQTIREQPYPSSYESKPRPSALTQQSMGSPMVQRVSHVVHSAPPASRREDPFSKLHYGLKMDSPPRYADSFDDSYVEPIYTKPLVRKAQSVPNNYSATAPWLEDEREGSIDPWLESQREKLRLRRELNDPDMLRRREQEKLLLEELKHVHDERMTRFNKREADYTVEGFGVRAEEEQHLVPEPEFIVLKREIIENPADLPPRTLLMRQWSDSATSQQYASQHQPIYLTNDRLSANRPNGRDRSPPSPNEMSSRLSNKSPFQRSAAPVSTTWRSPSAPPDRPTDFSRLQDILWDAEYSRNATTPTPSLSKVSSPKSILKKPKSADSQTSIGVQASSTPNRFFNGYREQVDSPSSRVFDLEPAQPPQSGDNFDSTQGYRPETPSSAYRPETPAFPRMRGETPLPYHPLLYSDFDKNMVNPSSAMAPTSARNTSLMVRSPSPASQYYAQSRRSSLTSLVEPMDVVNQHPVFVKDTSKYWYKPNISRDEAISILKDKPPGTFIMRDSNSFPGAFGLALKVATPPPGVQTKSNDGSELVRHFLIEPTAKGVKLKGCNNEPVFGSLAALVYQHSITPLALPCKLLLPDYDPGAIAGEHPNTAQALLEQGAACNVTYLFSCDTESLTGPEAVRRAIDQALTMAQQKQLAPISVHFKVASAGITITDISRKLFFRRHYPVNHVTFCGIDPDDRRWNAGVGSQPSRIFGFVARKIANRTENACHIFAEFEPEQPATAIVNFVTKVMMAPLHSNLSSSSSTSMR